MDKSNEYRHNGWLRVLALIVPYFIIVGIFQAIGFFLSGTEIFDANHEMSSIQKVIINFCTLIGTFLLIWIFMKFVDKEPFIKLGFQTKNRAKDFVAGILIGAFVMASGYLLLLVLEEIQFVHILFDAKELILSISLFIIVSFTEEVLFRGYILKNLMTSFNKYVALIISSILFAIAHGINPNIDLLSLINIFLAGIILGLTFIHTKNLWFPIALHLSWNLFQTVFGFNVSGQDTYSLIEFSIKENNLFNGGAFGFEGSILSAIYLVALIISIGFYYTKKIAKNKS